MHEKNFVKYRKCAICGTITDVGVILKKNRIICINCQDNRKLQKEIKKIIESDEPYKKMKI